MRWRLSNNAPQDAFRYRGASRQGGRSGLDRGKYKRAYHYGNAPTPGAAAVLRACRRGAARLLTFATLESRLTPSIPAA